MIKVENLEKSFKNGENIVKILKGISVTIPKNKFVTILGPSGSGKTTFLNIVAGLEPYEHGCIIWEGQDLIKLTDKKLESLRVHQIGYVFQEYFLLNNLTLIENVLLSGKIVGKTRQDAEKSLNEVGLSEEHYNKLPEQLSGGQKQRVAIARAIVKKPELLICDEPTGALDTKSSKQILSLLKKIQHEQNTTIMMVTHNEKIAQISDKVIYLKDGLIHNEYNAPSLTVGEVDW